MTIFYFPLSSNRSSEAKPDRGYRKSWKSPSRTLASRGSCVLPSSFTANVLTSPVTTSETPAKARSGLSSLFWATQPTVPLSNSRRCPSHWKPMFVYIVKIKESFMEIGRRLQIAFGRWISPPPPPPPGRPGTSSFPPVKSCLIAASARRYEPRTSTPYRSARVIFCLVE